MGEVVKCVRWWLAGSHRLPCTSLSHFTRNRVIGQWGKDSFISFHRRLHSLRKHNISLLYTWFLKYSLTHNRSPRWRTDVCNYTFCKTNSCNYTFASCIYTLYACKYTSNV